MSRLNMTNEQFWTSTIQDIWAAMDAWDMRREYETDFQRAMIYAQEGLRRTKRMPSMHAWLTHGKRKKATQEEVIRARNDHAAIMRRIPKHLQNKFALKGVR